MPDRAIVNTNTLLQHTITRHNKLALLDFTNEFIVLRIDLEFDATAAFGVITSAQVGHRILALPVHVHVAGLAFETLMDETVQQRAAVVAKRRRSVRVNLELVLGPGVIAVDALVDTRTLECDELVAPFVDNVQTGGALEACVRLQHVRDYGTVRVSSCCGYSLIKVTNLVYQSPR